jgi:tight adherence protein C
MYSLESYYGLRIVCALGSGALIAFALFSWRGLSGQTLVLSYVALMVGYYLPAWGLRWRRKEQTRRIVQELPDALDILLVCMNAGLSFDRALLRVSVELKYVAPVLAREFERYFYEVNSGLPRPEALTNLAERNQVNALTSVVNVLLQSVRFGTDIVQALRIHADSLRMERKQFAEEKAAKVSTKLVLPTVVFIMPALIIVVLGPTGIRLLERLRSLIWD